MCSSFFSPRRSGSIQLAAWLWRCASVISTPPSQMLPGVGAHVILRRRRSGLGSIPTKHCTNCTCAASIPTPEPLFRRTGRKEERRPQHISSHRITHISISHSLYILAWPHITINSIEKTNLWDGIRSIARPDLDSQPQSSTPIRLQMNFDPNQETISSQNPD